MICLQLQEIIDCKLDHKLSSEQDNKHLNQLHKDLQVSIESQMQVYDLLTTAKVLAQENGLHKIYNMLKNINKDQVLIDDLLVKIEDIIANCQNLEFLERLKRLLAIELNIYRCICENYVNASTIFLFDASGIKKITANFWTPLATKFQENFMI